jgi:hypothetical protein
VTGFSVLSLSGVFFSNMLLECLMEPIALFEHLGNSILSFVIDVLNDYGFVAFRAHARINGAHPESSYQFWYLGHVCAWQPLDQLNVEPVPAKL